jgi:uncharacterized RDD family membrane protein YckC
MQCTRCGAQVTPPASFCPQCGAALLPPAPGAGGVSHAAPYAPAPAAPRPACAGFWRRLAAFLIDNLILNVLGYLLFILLIIPTIPLTGIGSGMDPEDLAWPRLGAMFLTVPIGLVMTWLYYAVFESSARQATLGKMALGMRVTDLAGRRLSFARATGRYFAKWVSSLTLLIGYLMAAFTEKKQALHDLIAGTLVVKE